MEIKTIKTTRQVEIEETLVRYSQEEVEQLIRKDLHEQGYEVKSITIITKSKYVDDDWGMNRSLTTYFEGVNVVVSST